MAQILPLALLQTTAANCQNAAMRLLDKFAYDHGLKMTPFTIEVVEDVRVINIVNTSSKTVELSPNRYDKTVPMAEFVVKKKDEDIIPVKKATKSASAKAATAKAATAKAAAATPPPVTAPARPKSPAATVTHQMMTKILITGNRKMSHKWTDVSYKCNGLIVDPRTWSYLVVPIQSFNCHPSAEIVERMIANGDYNYLPARDATIFNIYSWTLPNGKHQWALGTTNGHDVSRLVQMGAKTYAELLYITANKLYPDFVAAAGMTLKEDGFLDFANLSRDFCYTIGMRCHSLHPLLNDPEGLWQIQSVNLKTLDVYPDLLTILPVQESAPLTTSFKALKAQCADALTQALDFMRTVTDVTIPAETPAQPFNYGYILQATKRDIGMYGSLLIPSPLLDAVRKYVYSVPQELKISSEEKMSYNALQAFFCGNWTQFSTLFPVWEPFGKKFERTIDSLVPIIVHIMRQKEQMAKEPISDTPRNVAAKKIVDDILSREKISGFSKYTPDVIRDYVRSPNYIMLVFKIFKLDKGIL